MFVKSCVDISLRDIEKDKITRSDTSPFFLENRLCAIIVPLFYRYPSTLFYRRFYVERQIFTSLDFRSNIPNIFHNLHYEITKEARNSWFYY